MSKYCIIHKQMAGAKHSNIRQTITLPVHKAISSPYGHTVQQWYKEALSLVSLHHSRARDHNHRRLFIVKSSRGTWLSLTNTSPDPHCCRIHQRRASLTPNRSHGLPLGMSSRSDPGTGLLPPWNCIAPTLELYCSHLGTVIKHLAWVTRIIIGAL